PKPHPDEDGHGEPSIEKLLAEASRHRQGEIGEQLPARLREDAFGKGLKRACRFKRNSPYAPQVQRLECGNGCGTDHRAKKNPGAVMDRQTKLVGGESVCACAPCGE